MRDPAEGPAGTQHPAPKKKARTTVWGHRHGARRQRPPPTTSSPLPTWYGPPVSRLPCSSSPLLRPPNLATRARRQRHHTRPADREGGGGEALRRKRRGDRPPQQRPQQRRWRRQQREPAEAVAVAAMAGFRAGKGSRGSQRARPPPLPRPPADAPSGQRRLGAWQPRWGPSIPTGETGGEERGVRGGGAGRESGHVEVGG